MRILLVNKYGFLKGGAERAVFDMAWILKQHGHDVAFFSMEHEENTPEVFPASFIKNIEYHTKHSLWESIRIAGKIFWNAEAKQKMEDMIDRFRPDIVHFHNIYHQFSPSIILPVWKRRIASVMTLHDFKMMSPSRILFSPKRGAWKNPIPSFWEVIRDPFVQGSRMKSLLCLAEYWIHRLFCAYKKISIYIAPSLFLKQKYGESGFSGKVIHLPNPLPDGGNRIQKAKNARKIPKNDAPFVFLGRLDFEKGVGFLLEAFSKYDGPSPLFIIGDGPERKNLVEKAWSLGLLQDRKIIFMGRRSGKELDTILLGCKSIIVPSLWYENQPYVIMEALSFGVPVIVPDGGALLDMIDEGKNGFSYKSGNSRSLSDLLGRMDMKDEKLWETIKESALERARSYDSERFYEKLFEVYMRITNNA